MNTKEEEIKSEQPPSTLEEACELYLRWKKEATLQPDINREIEEEGTVTTPVGSQENRFEIEIKYHKKREEPHKRLLNKMCENMELLFSDFVLRNYPEKDKEEYEAYVHNFLSNKSPYMFNVNFFRELCNAEEGQIEKPWDILGWINILYSLRENEKFNECIAQLPAKIYPDNLSDKDFEEPEDIIKENDRLHDRMMKVLPSAMKLKEKDCLKEAADFAWLICKSIDELYEKKLNLLNKLKTKNAVKAQKKRDIYMHNPDLWKYLFEVINKWHPKEDEQRERSNINSGEAVKRVYKEESTKILEILKQYGIAEDEAENVFKLEFYHWYSNFYKEM